MSINTYDIIIIGGGPAGTGIFLKALKDGKLSDFLNKKIALIEKSERLIKGNITNYHVNSDTFSSVFLECLEGDTPKQIDVISLNSEIEDIQKYKDKSIPLNLLNNYYNKLGDLLKNHLNKFNNCHLYMNNAANRIVKSNEGYKVFLENNNEPIVAKKIVITSGANPKNIDLNKFHIAKDISLANFSDKIIHSDSILKNGVPNHLEQRLQEEPKIIILGGSHSAFSVAHYFLHHQKNYNFKAQGISIWCNEKPKIYFPIKQDALASGYDDFTDQDFCPITNKLYRLAGLRMDGRELYMNMLGLNNTTKENRVCLNLFSENDPALVKELETSTLIVTALGYTFNMIPLFDDSGNQLRFIGEETGHWVNNNCEILDIEKNVVPGIFASGLASGFIPTGDLGGEPTFEGQTNGIWYYQNALADLILKNLLA